MYPQEARVGIEKSEKRQNEFETDLVLILTEKRETL